jgi:hypothetical protein
MMDSIFKNVTIVPVDAVSPFEWTELVSPASDNPAVVRHPFLVVGDIDSGLLLLDQTELFLSLVASGLTHVPVQQCHHESVQLISERLALTGFGRRDLDRLMAAHPDQLMTGLEEKDSSGYISLAIEFLDGEKVTVHARHSSRLGCPASLDMFFRAVLARGQYLHATDVQFRPGTPFKVHAPTARLIPPKFTLQDLFSAAASGHRFPPGLIQARTAYRVFNVDFPVPVLVSDIPVEEKEIFLRDLILFREQSCRTAYFDGPVYILNR